MADQAQDKSIRLKFVVDDASVQKTRQALQALTSDLTKLAEQLRNANIGGALSGFAGKGIGGQAGGLLTSTDPKQQITAQVGGGFAGKVVQSLREMMTGLSGGTKAMKGLSDSLKQAVTSQKSDLESLRNTVDDLTDSYSKLRGVQSGLGRGAAASGVPSGGVAPAGYTGLVDPYGRPVSAQSVAGGGAGAPPVGASAAGGAASASQPGVMAQLGKVVDRFVGPAAIGQLAIGGATTLADEATRQYMRYGQQAAARSDVWSPNMRRALSGDLSLGLVQNALNKDKDYQALSQQIGAVKFGGGLNALTGGSLGGVVGRVLNPMGTAREFMNATGDAQANTELMAKMQEMQANKEKEMAVDMAYANRFQSNMGGKFSWMHATGQDYKYNPHTGEAIQDRIGLASARRAAAGFTDEEYMGAFGQVQSVAGRRAANALAGQSMYGVASGISNAGSIAGQAAIGGGLNSGFMGYLYGAQGGPRGYDPGALGVIGQSIAQSTMAGGIATSGVGTLNAMLAGAGGGMNGPQDMLQARNMMAGLQSFGNITSGGLDKYQSGINTLNAAHALGPRASAYSIDYLANKMTPTQMMDIMAGGKVDPKLAALGITRGNVTSMFNADKASMFNRYQDSGGNTSADVTMRAFRQSGKSLKDFVAGSKDKKGTRAALAAALGVSEGVDLGAAEGELDALLGGGAKGGRHSGPRGVAGGKSPEAKAAADRLKAEEENVGKTLEIGKKLGDVNKDFAAMSNAFQNNVSNLSTSADGAAQALRGLEEAAASLAVAQGGQAARTAVNQFKQQYRGKRSELLAAAKSATGLTRAEMIEAANEMGGGGNVVAAQAVTRGQQSGVSFLDK